MVTLVDFELMEEIHQLNTPKYFVAARGYNGSRHYSETVEDYTTALDLFNKYAAVLRYVSEGGYITLYGSRYGDDAEIIKQDWVI